MMGKARIHEPSHDSIQRDNISSEKPMARMVATPETRNVMMNVSASGSHVPIDYTNPAEPTLSVRLQEMFGLSDTPDRKSVV